MNRTLEDDEQRYLDLIPDERITRRALAYWRDNDCPTLSGITDIVHAHYEEFVKEELLEEYRENRHAGPADDAKTTE